MCSPPGASSPSVYDNEARAYDRGPCRRYPTPTQCNHIRQPIDSWRVDQHGGDVEMQANIIPADEASDVQAGLNKLGMNEAAYHDVIPLTLRGGPDVNARQVFLVARDTGAGTDGTEWLMTSYASHSGQGVCNATLIQQVIGTRPSAKAALREMKRENWLRPLPLGRLAHNWRWSRLTRLLARLADSDGLDGAEKEWKQDFLDTMFSDFLEKASTQPHNG
jgi:hypothetical protein